MPVTREIPPRPADSPWSVEAWPRFHRFPRSTEVKIGAGRVTHLTDPKLYAPEYVARLVSETRWTLTPDSRPALEAAVMERIGLREVDCPLCAGELTSVDAYTGADTGIAVVVRVPCKCRTWRAFYPQWTKVPRRYRDVRLATLAPIQRAPMTLSVSRQRAIIDHVKAHPNDSFLLWGESGTGKTHISYALHRRALVEWSKDTQETVYAPVLRSQVTALLDQNLARITGRHSADEARPVQDITVEKIKRIAAQKINGKNMRPVVIFDEIDKLGNVTEHKTNLLLSLINAVYEHEGQIIATSNYSPAWMMEHWGKELAGPILNRCGGDVGTHTIHFAEK